MRNANLLLNHLLKFFLFISSSTLALAKTGDELNTKSEFYQWGKQTRDGIGKYYMGREISQVMGHLGAGWLERPKREQEERTDLLIKNMNLSKTDHVGCAADQYLNYVFNAPTPIGSGTHHPRNRTLLRPAADSILTGVTDGHSAFRDQ